MAAKHLVVPTSIVYLETKPLLSAKSSSKINSNYIVTIVAKQSREIGSVLFVIKSTWRVRIPTIKIGLVVIKKIVRDGPIFNAKLKKEFYKSKIYFKIPVIGTIARVAGIKLNQEINLVLKEGIKSSIPSKNYKKLWLVNKKYNNRTFITSMATTISPLINSSLRLIIRV